MLSSSCVMSARSMTRWTPRDRTGPGGSSSFYSPRTRTRTRYPWRFWTPGTRTWTGYPGWRWFFTACLQLKYFTLNYSTRYKGIRVLAFNQIFEQRNWVFVTLPNTDCKLRRSNDLGLHHQVAKKRNSKFSVCDKDSIPLFGIKRIWCLSMDMLVEIKSLKIGQDEKKIIFLMLMWNLNSLFEIMLSEYLFL